MGKINAIAQTFVLFYSVPYEWLLARAREYCEALRQHDTKGRGSVVYVLWCMNSTPDKVTKSAKKFLKYFRCSFISSSRTNLLRPVTRFTGFR